MSAPSRETPSLAQSPPSNGSPVARANPETRSPHSRNPSLRISHMPSAASQHRHSLSEHRHPPSPRASRQLSISQLAVQELIDNPPHRSAPDPRFAGRDWRTVQVGELVNEAELQFVNLDVDVETATNLLAETSPSVLLVREHDAFPLVGTFDYTDLNAYLLLVLGLVRPEDDHSRDFGDMWQRAHEGKPVFLGEIKNMGRREPLTFIPHTAELPMAIQSFGRGVHRLMVVKEGTDQVIGILSQSRLLKFLYENGRNFPIIDQLLSQYLRDLRVGSNTVVCINGDRHLADALVLLYNEGISSLAVTDHANNVIGNISTTDVRLLTKSSSLPLFRNTCIHFISVILSTRGMFAGQDTVPVFHVTPFNTLAHTLAKLVATKSHRLWITEPISPSSSGPPTPSLQSATMVPTSSHSSSISTGSGQPFMSPPLAASSETSQFVTDASPKTPAIAPTGPAVSASALPGARISGSLVGVVSLTDILILFAKAGGLQTTDPEKIRFRRRRSSSSGLHKSVDFGFRARQSSSSDLQKNSPD